MEIINISHLRWIDIFIILDVEHQFVISEGPRTEDELTSVYIPGEVCDIHTAGNLVNRGRQPYNRTVMVHTGVIVSKPLSVIPAIIINIQYNTSILIVGLELNIPIGMSEVRLSVVHCETKCILHHLTNSLFCRWRIISRHTKCMWDEGQTIIPILPPQIFLKALPIMFIRSVTEIYMRVTAIPVSIPPASIKY